MSVWAIIGIIIFIIIILTIIFQPVRTGTWLVIELVFELIAGIFELIGEILSGLG